MAHDLTHLLERLDDLEARVAALEGAGVASGPRRVRDTSGGASRASAAPVDAAGWTQTYVSATLDAPDSWIELHEPSARPHLQRMLRELIASEGPITERLAMDRIRRAWGLSRAGGRVQEAIDQAIRQLVARSQAERDGDALREPGSQISVVRVPDPEDDETRRGAEDVPIAELALAANRIVQGTPGGADADAVTMAVAKLFGWTRRGGAIQQRLEQAIDAAVRAGTIAHAPGGKLVPGDAGAA